MAGEEWARRILEKDLKRNVALNDDGTASGMYDLRIGSADAPEMAVECVGTVDPKLTETWNLGPAEGPLKLALKGDWLITLTPSARIKAIKQRVESLLREFEGRGLREVRIDHFLKRHDWALYEALDSLKVTRAYCLRLPGTGKVHLGMGESVARSTPRVLRYPDGFGEFLRDYARQDVLRKLQRSGAPDRHAFVFVSFGGAP
jgi:hypothetical protein